jgi:hypothetical protein
MTATTLETLAGIIIGFGIGWLIASWIKRKLKKKQPPPPPVWKAAPSITTTQYKETEMPDTNNLYSDCEASDLLDAKMKCLEWAIGNASNDSADKVVEAAQKYWDFIALEKDDQV